jgi:hypothetical protein
MPIPKTEANAVTACHDCCEKAPGQYNGLSTNVGAETIPPKLASHLITFHDAKKLSGLHNQPMQVAAILQQRVDHLESCCRLLPQATTKQEYIDQVSLLRDRDLDSIIRGFGSMDSAQRNALRARMKAKYAKAIKVWTDVAKHVAFLKAGINRI